MTRYTRHQLIVLLVLLGAAGLGLAVGHWRRAHPDVVDRLEMLDRSPALPTGSLALPARAQASREWSAGRRRPPRALARESAAALIDLNRAGAAELTRLPGVGRELAARIVAAREARGPFATVDDLEHVRGLRLRQIDRLRPFVTAAP